MSSVDFRASSSVADALKTQKRKRSSDDADEEKDKSEEEEWDLQKVVFIEDVRSVPIGKVTKVCLSFLFS